MKWANFEILYAKSCSLPELSIGKKYQTWVFLFTCFPLAREVFLPQHQLHYNVWNPHVRENSPIPNIIKLNLCPLVSFVPQIHLGKFLISVPDCKMKQLPGCIAVSRVKTKVIRNERVEFCRGGIIHPGNPSAWFYAGKQGETIYYTLSFCLLYTDWNRLISPAGYFAWANSCGFWFRNKTTDRFIPVLFPLSEEKLSHCCSILAQATAIPNN